MASTEHQNANKNVLLWLLEEHMREKQVVLNDIHHLQRELDKLQKVAMEIEELGGQLLARKGLRDQDDASVKEKMEELEDKFFNKLNQWSCMEDRHNQLYTKKWQSNYEAEESRKALIYGWTDFLNDRAQIGIKRMGEIDVKIFHNLCRERFPPGVADDKAVEICSWWQEKLRDPQWYPFKVVPVGSDKYEQTVVEDDELLKSLEEDWGLEGYQAVMTAFEEMNEYNPSGRYLVSELWNFKEKRKASMKEIAAYILEKCKQNQGEASSI